MKLGFIGLGRMGSRMVTKLLTEGHEVMVWNRTEEKIEELRSSLGQLAEKYSSSDSIADLVSKLTKPRIVWLMLPAGEATEEILKEVARYVEKGDVIVDGGNAHFPDTQRRYEEFTARGILFLGIGVSGGVIAAKSGYPLMVGGSKDGYDTIKPILDSLAKPSGGHEYFGEGGTGHFVKMVHNGIEYGLMQSIGEGFGVLEKSPYKLDTLKVAQLYQKGTLVSGFMMERTIEALTADPELAHILGYIEESGEGSWTVDEAKKLGVPISTIEESLNFRRKSREDQITALSFAAKLVAALRNAFGGHEVKKKD